MKLGGGRFSTANIGFRSRKLKKVNDAPQGGPATRRPTPGGKMGRSNIGSRCKKRTKTTPGPLNPPTYPAPGGGHFSTALIGYRSKVAKKVDGVPVRPPPAREKIAGGRIGRSNLNYRIVNGCKPNSLPGPVNPPSFPVSGGGHFSTSLVGYRTKIPQKIDGVPQANPPSRPIAPGGKFGSALLGYRTNRTKRATDILQDRGVVLKVPVLTELKKFGENTPGGSFNTHGAKHRNDKIQIRPQSSPMYNVRGCGDTLLPGGGFNVAGAHKEMFRFTYLDERG